MTTELDVRFCTNPDGGRLPLPALQSMISALSTPGTSDLSFRGARVAEQGSLTPVHHETARLTADELLSLAGRWNSPNYSISTRTALASWFLDASGELQRKLIPARLNSAGGRRSGRSGDWWADGDAGLSIDSVTPYRFPVSADEELSDDAGVDRNVRQLIQLLGDIITTLNPASFKAYSDAGEFFPFNAHAAYYADAGETARDITAIRRLFVAGHTVLELPPLADVGGDLADFVFHGWRDHAAQRTLQAELSELALTETVVTARRAHQVGRAMSVVTPTSDSLFVLSDTGAPFNFFLDQFYSELSLPAPAP